MTFPRTVNAASRDSYSQVVGARPYTIWTVNNNRVIASCEQPWRAYIYATEASLSTQADCLNGTYITVNRGDDGYFVVAAFFRGRLVWEDKEGVTI